MIRPTRTGDFRVASLDLEQFENSVADYGEAIALKPEFAYAYVNRAINFEAMGEKQRAMQT